MEYSTEKVPPNSTRGHSRRKMAVTLAVSALVPWMLVASLFAVDVTEHALVTRFGAIVRSVSEPGLHLKLPLDKSCGCYRCRLDGFGSIVSSS